MKTLWCNDNLSLAPHLGTAVRSIGRHRHDLTSAREDPMTLLAQRYSQIEAKLGRLSAVMERDRRSCPELHAVLLEVEQQAEYLIDAINLADPAKMREALLEVEEALGMAQAVAEADPRVGDQARRAILGFHQLINALQRELGAIG